MSFDEEPEQRYLLYHPESDSLFEAFGSFAEECMNEEPVEDVTGEPEYEKRFEERRK